MAAISRSGILRRDDQLPDRAHHGKSLAVGTLGGNGVKTVLQGQRIARVGIAQAGGDDAPGEIAGGEDGFRHHGLMGPVEGADAQMNDTGRDRADVIGGTGDVCRQGGERGQGKTVAAHDA